MIIFLHGNAFDKRQKKFERIISSLRKKRPTSELFSLNEENFSEGQMEELLFGSGLFDEKHIVILNNITRIKDTGGRIFGKLDKMAESVHVFIILEDEPTPDIYKKISERAHMTEGFERIEKREREPNVFSFTDAIGERDRRKAWTLFNLNIFHGRDPEEFHGLALWMIKNMRAAKVSMSPKDAGMKPYPYKKAKVYSENYSSGELEELSMDLIEALRKDRRGETPLRSSLERILLEIEV